MKKISIKSMCVCAMLAALVCVSTMVIQIPMPATNGYIHLGDGIILIASIFFGWKYGMIAGGLGSFLADILTGYAAWAPFTLIIKALMGLAVGKISNSQSEIHSNFSLRNFSASVVGTVIMVTGYFIGGAILEGSALVSLGSVPANLIQGAGGIAVYIAIGFLLNRTHIKKYI